MAMTLFSPYKANEGGVTCPRDASFSSYLDTTERDFVRSLSQSVNSPSPTREVFTPRQSVGNNKSIFRARKSGELDVFGANKYFGEKIIKDGNHNHRDFQRTKRDDFLERKSSKSNIISATNSSTKSPTPSLKSARSFNSQIGLLLPKKGLIGHKIFSGFQCKGFCFDKKSVSTTNTQHIVQSSCKSYQNNGNNWDMKNRVSHQQHFAFPIIDTSSLSLEDDDYQSCNKSMDGFEFHQIGKHETEQNLDTNHSILSWNAIPNPTIVTTPFPFPLKRETRSYYSCNVKDEDECSSDTSSDLFEIETLTGVPGIQTSTAPYYEPSEGSIQWSVVTASDAADNFSDLHDDDHHHDEDDHKSAITIERRTVQKSSTLGGMFLGCTNRKAIDVVENHYNNQS